MTRIGKGVVRDSIMAVISKDEKSLWRRDFPIAQLMVNGAALVIGKADGVIGMLRRPFHLNATTNRQERLMIPLRNYCAVLDGHDETGQIINQRPRRDCPAGFPPL